MAEEILLIKSIKTGRQYPGVVLNKVNFKKALECYYDRYTVHYDTINYNYGRHSFSFPDFFSNKIKTTIKMEEFCKLLKPGKDSIITILEDRRNCKIKKKIGKISITKSLKAGYIRYFGTELDTRDYKILKTLKLSINKPFYLKTSEPFT